MKDIGALETRIGNLEETTSLSLLESKTESLVITDPTTGMDRFKNGFVVDPFNNFDVADKTVPFIKYDLDEGKLVSLKYTDSIDLLVGSNSVVGTNGTPDLSLDPRFVDDFGNPNIKVNKKIVIKNFLNDHRVFMTSVIAGLTFGGNWKIYDKDSINSSFPNFLKIIQSFKQHD